MSAVLPGREFFARTVHGLEEIAAGEIGERLAAEAVTTGHRLVRFRSAAPPTDLLGLRSVDDVFAGLLERPGVGHARGELRELAGWARELDLGPALDWIGGARSVRLDRGMELIASFLGARNYTRFELEEAVGLAIGERVGAPLVRLREPERSAPDLSFRLHLDHETALLGVRVGAVPLHRRGYKLDSVPGSLHPPVAFALCRLAGPAGLLLDPFCGAGTIAIESGSAALALDVSAAAVCATVRNAARAGAPVLAVRGDAGALPLAAGSVGRVVTNPPWRNQVGYAGSLAGRPYSLWRELARVLAPDGLAVVLGAGDGEAIGAAGLARTAAVRLSLFGTWVDVSILRRR
jgi:tRNA (guanine6-N2)-methyltransferase